MDSVHDVDRRLNELEVKASFTDDLLEQLNLTIFRQQQQIDGLLRQCAELRQQQSEAGAGGPRQLRDELPPPY